MTTLTIPRRRLHDRMATRPVVLVLGAAGYGKSVLLSSWLQADQPPGVVAWLGLEPSHQDPGRLVADLLTCLRTPVAGSLGDALDSLEAPPAFADHLVLVDAIHQRLFDADTPVTLVLDDIQHLAHAAEGLAVVDHFMAWAPPTTRVVLATRSMPSLRLQRLRLEDRVELIGHQDLAFTEEETAAAAQVRGITLEPEELTRLHALTEGWPAAVGLALLAMRGGSRGDRHLLRQTDEALASYLTTEVMASLTPELRRFVVDATVDELVCAPLVDAVRGTTDSAGLLAQCVDQGLFLTPEPALSDDTWFRWHSLFAAHMSARREAAGRAMEQERCAARWWSAVDPDVAVTHALAGRDAELAGEIAASAWLDLVLTGRAETAKRMAAAVPDHVRSAAELHLALAYVAARQGAIDAATAQLAAARRVSSRLDGAALARHEVRAAVIELFVVPNRAALSDSLARGRRLLAAVESGSVEVDVATLALVRLHVGTGEARLLDNPSEAVRLLDQARRAADDAGYTALGLTARAEACIPSIPTRRLEETRLVAEQVLADAEAKGWGDLPGTASAHGYLGWLALWQGDARRAMHLLDRCLESLLPGDWGMRGLATTIHAQACLSAGDVEAAERDCIQLRQLAKHGRMPDWWPSLQNGLDAMLLAATGRLDEARQLADEPVDGPEFHLASCYRAAVQLKARRPDRTLEIIDSIPPERLYPHVSGAVDALRAQALADSGARTAAHRALERALSTSAAFGFLEPYRLVGSPLLALLTEHIHTGTADRDHLGHVLARLTADLRPAEAGWGETLTRRELSILSCLATNLSHSEIAEAEFISVNTVKTHVRHLYRKLEVSNRRAAVRRATELGLV